MDPDPRKEIEVGPDPDLDPERGLKWIRIRIRNAGYQPYQLSRVQHFKQQLGNFVTMKESEQFLRFRPGLSLS